VIGHHKNVPVSATLRYVTAYQSIPQNPTSLTVGFRYVVRQGLYKIDLWLFEKACSNQIYCCFITIVRYSTFFKNSYNGKVTNSR
jgi:hypothetical protein